MFNFLNNYQNVFQSGYTILNSYQEVMKIAVSLHPN